MYLRSRTFSICLLALSKTDEALFADVVAILEKKQSGGASEIALLAGWLNQIGRAEVAFCNGRGACRRR